MNKEKIDFITIRITRDTHTRYKTYSAKKQKVMWILMERILSESMNELEGLDVLEGK